MAIKSLPGGFAQHPERLTRFEREARLPAALQHSRIATIHGLEESGSHRYLVMELVAGEPLAHRIAPGRIPVPEAREIAEGLEDAQREGDRLLRFKAGNVQVGTDDSVKLLDSGLAKAFDADSSGVV